MNIGRFYAAITELRFAIDSEKTVQQMQTLHSSLHQSIQTQNPDTAKVFKSNYSALIESLDTSRLNSVYPTRKMIFQDIGALSRVGTGLKARLQTILSENNVTPANALAEIEKINADVSGFYKQLKTIEDVFEKLDIEFDELHEGGFEIGFSFPKDVVGKSVHSLGEELLEMDYALRTFQEVAGEGGGSPDLSTISASEWQFFLDSLPETAACLSIAIERVVALYKNNLEIKLLKKQLEEKQLPEAVTKPLQDHIEQTVKKEIKKIAAELVEEIYEGDKGRKNELIARVPKALRYLADRIDRGGTIEVHAEPPLTPTAAPEDATAEALNLEFEKAQARYQDLMEKAAKVNERMQLISNIQRAKEPTLQLNYKNGEDE